MIFENQAGFCEQLRVVVDGATVRSWFDDPKAVLHYARSVSAVGLWRSERLVFESVFRRSDRLLDVGCGAGRIAVGLWALGYERIEGVDYSEDMIVAAREIVRAQQLPIEFACGDATTLRFSEGVFDGLIFGFNGLMQIPGRENRRSALRELWRVARSGGRLVFTTHDREMAGAGAQVVWTAEREPNLEIGDRIGALPEGRIFMHWPDRTEILEDLAATGWAHVEDHLRSALANEPGEVRDFSDECRFWVCRKRDERAS